MSKKINKFAFQNITSGFTTKVAVGQCSSATVQVDCTGTCSVTIEGRTNPTSDEFYPIRVVNYNTFTMVDTIANAGNYLVVVDGLYDIKITATTISNDATIYVTMEG